MNFKFVARVLGGHTHVTIYAGVSPGCLGNCGNLVFRNEEWDALIEVMALGFQSSPAHFAEFSQDEQPKDRTTKVAS